jgi:hypothetical protein
MCVCVSVCVSVCEFSSCMCVCVSSTPSAFFPRHIPFSLALVRLPVAMCVFLHAFFIHRYILSPDGVLLCVCVSIEHVIFCVCLVACVSFLCVCLCAVLCVCVCACGPYCTRPALVCQWPCTAVQVEVPWHSTCPWLPGAMASRSS